MKHNTIIWATLILWTTSCNPGKDIHKGDLFLIHTTDNGYTTWIIDSISKKDIWYIPSDLQVHDSLYLDSLIHYRQYTDKPKKITKKDFKRLSLHQWQPNTEYHDK